MTREKAIELIGSMKGDLCDFYDDNDLTALEMAISALSENKGDLISRQATINALSKYVVYSDDGEQEINADSVFLTLEELPSAENKGEFDGMTNGEAMNYILRKTFPHIIFIRAVNECNKTKSIVYAEEWENTPYKAEKGGE